MLENTASSALGSVPELFAGLSDATPPVVGMDTGPEAPTTIGHRFATIFTRYCSAFASYMAEVAELAAIERSLLPAEHYALAVQVLPGYKIVEIKAKLGKAIRDRMVRHAEETFAPEGVELRINREEVGERFPVQVERAGADRHDLDERWYIDFDAVALWQYLEETYGGDAGKRLAWRQTADRLVSALELRRNSDVKMSGGKVIIEIRVWSEKAWSGSGMRLGSSTQQSVVRLFQSLTEFAEWAGRASLARLCRQQASDWSHYQRPVVSRERNELGDGCSYVTFHQKFEFRLSQQVAEQLQLFIAEFGPPLENSQS